MKSRACPFRSGSGGMDRSEALYQTVRGEAETLEFRGVAAPFPPPDTLKKDRILEEGMQQSQLISYADIAEVRTVSGAAACNQLLADGWVLLGIYPLTTVAEMTAGQPSDGQEQNKRQDIQRYVRRFVGYVVGKRRE
jgi:hypothetical protein